MTKIQNLSMILKIKKTNLLNSNVSVIVYWNLEFICNLVLEICDFIFMD